MLADIFAVASSWGALSRSNAVAAAVRQTLLAGGIARLCWSPAVAQPVLRPSPRCAASGGHRTSCTSRSCISVWRRVQMLDALRYIIVWNPLLLFGAVIPPLRLLIRPLCLVTQPLCLLDPPISAFCSSLTSHYIDVES